MRPINTQWRMPFGKHRDQLLTDIPIDYLQWVLDNCTRMSPALRTAIQEVLDEPCTENGLTLSSIVSIWYRTLASEFHPDHGGSHEAMKAVNGGRDVLVELAEMS